MKPLIIFFILIVYISQSMPAAGDMPFLKNDPQLNNSLGWNLLPNGMLFAGYDLDGNGKADVYTIRIVIRSFFSKRSVNEEAGNWPNYLTLLAKQDAFADVNFFYIAAKQPLLYALDFDEDESFDLIYKDPLEDGLSGNEGFYDSPGEMLAAEKGDPWLEYILSRLCTCQKKSCPLQQTARN